MLSNKVILLIGGSGLIGHKIALAVLENGAKVIVAGRTEAKDKFSDLTQELAANLAFATVDLVDPISVAALFQTAHDTYGRVDAVINCAFPRNERHGAVFEDVTFDDFQDNMNIHLGSAFLICQKASSYFTTVGGGNIINFASIYGFMPPRFEIYDDTPMTKEIEYVICKAGIIQLTKYLARYLKGRNIRVNCISPGGVLSGNHLQTFVHRYNAYGLNKGMLDPVDIAGTTVFLLSDHSTYVNGQNIVIDDGFTL